MNYNDELDRMVEAARRDRPPALDLRDSVLATLRSQELQEVPDNVVWAPRSAAALALAAAVATAVPALQSFWSLTNPMSALFGALRNAL